MADLILAGSVSGTVTLSAPSSAGTVTVTLPAQTGTMLTTASTFAGTGPAFSAYANAAQSVTSNVDTKVLFGVETFDTNGDFTSSRFTPTVAGYYQLNTTVRFGGTSPSQYIVYIFKNGSQFAILSLVNANLGSPVLISGSVIALANGTTDYFEVYENITATSPTVGAGGPSNSNTFSGALVRSA